MKPNSIVIALQRHWFVELRPFCFILDYYKQLSLHFSHSTPLLPFVTILLFGQFFKIKYLLANSWTFCIVLCQQIGGNKYCIMFSHISTFYLQDIFLIWSAFFSSVARLFFGLSFHIIIIVVIIYSIIISGHCSSFFRAPSNCINF